VIGADANGLGVARSLGRAGVPVIVVEDDPDAPAMHSRYVWPFLVGGLSGPPLVDGLLTLRTHLNQNPVLFPTYDYHVDTVSKYRERLKSAFVFRLADHGCVAALLHKAGFQALAERHGFPVPRAMAIRNEQDLGALAGLRFPAVIKPGTKDWFFNHQAPRACRVASRQEAEAACRNILLHAPDLIVQEWIEGADSDIYFCLQYRGEGGICVCSFTGRKLRCWPPQTGNTLSCVAAPEMNTRLSALTTAFFDAVGFVGLCSLEFKRDRASGELLMVEPTVGRTDWQEEIATLCGVNIPLAAYCHELGLPLPPVAQPNAPVLWRAPTCYWRSIVVTHSYDHVPSGTKVVSAIWRSDDPVPLLFLGRQWLRRLARRLIPRARIGSLPVATRLPEEGLHE
jgi:predicted ATP-grasp superfamily ATP-dependent carboligase